MYLACPTTPSQEQQTVTVQEAVVSGAAVVSASNFFTICTFDDLANKANISNAVETTMADIFTPTEVTDLTVKLDQDNNLISVTFMAPGDDEDQGTCKNIISL